MDSLDPPSGLSLDSNYPFDQVTTWSANQVSLLYPSTTLAIPENFASTRGEAERGSSTKRLALHSTAELYQIKLGS